MTALIHDTVIVTGDDNDTVHYGASIAIDGTKIAAIGPNAELQQRYPAAERIDGRGKMVMPGFANTHTHLTMTLARGVQSVMVDGNWLMRFDKIPAGFSPAALP
jgi:5-methylthioadenosine/S-adenosylhomocysteine deaminase